MNVKIKWIGIALFLTFSFEIKAQTHHSAFFSLLDTTSITSSSVVITGNFNFYQTILYLKKNWASNPGTRWTYQPCIQIQVNDTTNPANNIQYQVCGETVYFDTSNYKTLGNPYYFQIPVTGLTNISSVPQYLSFASAQSGKMCFLDSNNYTPESSNPAFQDSIFWIVAQEPPVGYPNYPGNLITFFVRSYTTPISNNFITSGNQNICASSASNYQALPILATYPFGGKTGSINFLWQKKTSTNDQWVTCPNSADSTVSYTPAGFTNSNQTYYWESYRRIVSSAGYSDTSARVTVHYYPAKYNPVINISQVGVKQGKEISLLVKADNFYGHSQVTWSDSSMLTGAVRNTLLNYSNTVNVSIDPKTNYQNNVYQAKVYTGPTCPILKSRRVYLTAPDGDGNVYAAVTIGMDRWTINNLRATRYNDGTPIKGLVNPGTGLTASYSWYGGDSIINAIDYGALYNVAVINNATGKNVCPIGWKVADVMNWYSLINFVGGKTKAGASLKSTAMWANTSINSNTFNFNANPGGERENDKSFYGKGFLGAWWAFIPNYVLQANENFNSYMEMGNIDGSVYYINPDRGTQYPNNAHSIRCVYTALPTGQ